MASRNTKSNSGDGGNVAGIGDENGPDSGTTTGVSSGNDDSNPGVNPATLGDGYGPEYDRDGNGNLIIGKSGKPRKRRGRPAGTGTNTRASGGNAGKSGKNNNQNLTASINGLSQTFMVLHLGVANLIKFDDFALDEKEAKALAEATANCLDVFDVQPDPRVTAVAGLVSVAGTIYVPRLYLYKEQQKKKAEKNDNVFFMAGNISDGEPSTI